MDCFSCTDVAGVFDGLGFFLFFSSVKAIYTLSVLHAFVLSCVSLSAGGLRGVGQRARSGHTERMRERERERWGVLDPTFLCPLYPFCPFWHRVFPP